MSTDHPRIRVKAMLIAPNAEGTAHAVSVNRPTPENPRGFHRLIGGSVEFGETHRDAILREIDEELGARVNGLAYVGVVESIFRSEGQLGHEIVFLYRGRLDPAPAEQGATLTDSDSGTLPVTWRPYADGDVGLPLYPDGVREWLPS